MFNLDESKKRIYEIINSKTKVENKGYITNEDSFTFENGVRGWVTAIFVDMVGSSKIFKNENNENLARVLRAFTSETIDIMYRHEVRQIGIRGDCVYAIYTTPDQKDTLETFLIACEANTLLQKVLTPTLSNTKFKDVQFGIGCASSECLVVKAGKKRTEVNDTIWIGNAVVDAANLSGYANHPKSIDSNDKYNKIALNYIFYNNIQKQIESWSNYSSSWFKQESVNLGNRNETAYFVDLTY